MSEMNTTNEIKNTSEKKYWMSLEQWGGDPEFQKLAETEFLSSPLREGADGEGGWARREFLKLMGASLAMATTSCIRRPVQKIVPYVKQSEEVTHGVESFYTSTWSDGVENFGLLVRTKEGRPLKVEGNPLHPLNAGGLSARAQAHILSLYDPERLKAPQRNLLNKEKTNRDTISAKWDDLDAAVTKQLKKGNAVVLTGSVNSPSTRNLIADFCQGFKAKHVVWEPLSHEEIRNGQEACYGDAVVPFYRFDKAKVIVSVDADFLGTWIAPTTFTKQFSLGRKNPKNGMSQLVVFDSNYSLTGANADIRVRIKPSQQVTVLMGLAHDIVVKKGFGRYAGNSSIKANLEPFASAHTQLGVSEEVWSQLVDNLIKHKGESLVVAGGLPTMTAQAEQVQIAANFLNSALGNDGNTVDAKTSLVSAKASSLEFMSLIEDMKAGKIKTLIIHRTNPVYSAPSSGFKEALKKVEMVIYTGDRADETGLMADYLAPDNHSMESWGDSESYKGAVSIQQPTIRPLHDTRSFQWTLMTWAYLAETGPARLTKPESYYDYLRNYWRDEVLPAFGKGKDFESFWEEALQTGVVSSGLEKSSSERNFKIDSLAAVKPVNSSGFELVLHPTIMMMDGTLTNVSWLNELPDPVTKIVWDNYASISMATAEKLAVKEGHVLEIKAGIQVLKIPAHIQPGMHDDVIAIAVGYGRTAGGKVTNGVGQNAYALVGHSKSGMIYSGQTLEVKKTGLKADLACPQGHHVMEGRKIVAEATLSEYQKDEAANNHKHPIFSIWSGHEYKGHKWAMAIDLNSCTGCSACMVACQSENNVPVVGKKYVMQGREMHWIRIDRYFSGDPKDPHAVFQPVMCQHCDNAPCETVCPVLATVHSSEGLNDMVYNRCVGTRYCANNCPYKVRRFNWFNYAKLIEKPMHLALNPDVTVRERGVMEKCTFCTHRIKDQKIRAKVEDRQLKDGDVKTACEQSCPTGAIVFGDVNDVNSRVSKIYKEEKRAYALLEEFHAAPSVRYMTKIRNNNKESSGSGDASHGGGH